jgi:hypothetical protein
LDVDNSAFAGTVEINVGNLRFDDTLLLTNATLSVRAGSQLTTVIMANDATFAALDYEGVLVADGTYSAAQLNSLLGSTRFSGAGMITIQALPAAGPLYADWVASYPTLESQTNHLDDFEPDGVNNLLEYAMGGNPTNNDAAAVMPTSELDAGWLYLVYNRRENAGALDLTYTVVTGTNLVSGPMTNEVPEYGVSAETDGFVNATNRISTGVHDQGFMQLQVELDQ